MGELVTIYGEKQVILTFAPLDVNSVLVGAVMFAVDATFYNGLVASPYEFLKANVFNGIGSFYGTHPW